MTRAARIVTAVALAAAVTGCSKTNDVTCPPGFGLCAGVCLSISDDAQNCGACGNVCGAGQACVASACVQDCKAGLRASIVDRWGTWWDGLERPLASLADATAACEAIGGRLPVATEIYRTSYAVTGDVGQSYQTNWLWSLVPRDATNQFILAMSDGSTSYRATTTATAFRCVCPAASPAAFTGYACNGLPGQECFALSGANAGYAIDSQDRALLTKGGALWECGFQNGTLPTFAQYAEAIQAGAPNGTDTYLHVGDDTRYDLDTLVRWAGVETGWSASAKTTTSGMTDQRPFRCVGPTTVHIPAPGRPADAFVGAAAKAADAADRTAAGWAAAHQACFDAGGHLAYETELGALVQQGLPAGSGAWLWTADQQGWNGVQFLAGLLRWTDVAPGFGYYNAAPTYVNWAYKTDAGYAFRCVYYPVVARSAPTGCNTACFELDLPGASGAKLWLDNADRQSATLTAAISICANAGGHLASERDFTEAIRSGLPNGSGTLLHTSDVAYGSGGPLTTTLVRWSGVDGGFTDEYSTYMTWGANLNETRPYRCVWTNEIR